MSDFDTVFKQFKDNTKPMCELMGCPELVDDFIVDVEINRQAFKSFYEAGQQSRQVEIDELKKRINEATKLLSLIYEDSGWLDSIELRDVISKLKGKEND